MTVRAFETILIANRGEIACRVIRTARRPVLAPVAGPIGDPLRPVRGAAE